ncbi:MAG: DUF2130 domain-containing protein [Candidatus Sulfotelmatobacter sp.]
MPERRNGTELSLVEPVIVCPNCKKEIRLTESLAAPLVEATRRQYEQKLADKDSEVAKREAEVRRQEKAVAEAKNTVDDKIAEGIRKEREGIASEEARKARLLVSDELQGKSKTIAELEEILKTKDGKLAEAQKSQVELVRKRRELDDAKRELDLTVETRVLQSLAGVRDKAKREAEQELNLKVAEKEQTIAGMQRQIEALKRKAEQGSQQLQGEVQELELESVLAAKFPADLVEPVPKGEFGGDIVHRVLNHAGQTCGTLLWESKRTKNWSDGWLPKLRQDQRAAKADFALMVSRVLPKGVDLFDHIDGIWVLDPKCVIPLAIALRQSLIEVAAVRQAGDGQYTKMGMVYEYLTGPRFRTRIEAIVEKFSDMQEDLDKERKTMTRLWAKREEQIHGVLDATAGMYGDLQGIAGKSLDEIEGLEIGMLIAGNDAL